MNTAGTVVYRFSSVSQSPKFSWREKEQQEGEREKRRDEVGWTVFDPLHSDVCASFGFPRRTASSPRTSCRAFPQDETEMGEQTPAHEDSDCGGWKFLVCCFPRPETEPCTEEICGNLTRFRRGFVGQVRKSGRAQR